MIIKFKFLSFCGEQFQDYRAQGQSSRFVCFQKSVTKAIEELKWPTTGAPLAVVFNTED